MSGCVHRRRVLQRPLPLVILVRHESDELVGHQQAHRRRFFWATEEELFRLSLTADPGTDQIVAATESITTSAQAWRTSVRPSIAEAGLNRRRHP